MSNQGDVNENKDLLNMIEKNVSDKINTANLSEQNVKSFNGKKSSFGHLSAAKSEISPSFCLQMGQIDTQTMVRYRVLGTVKFAAYYSDTMSKTYTYANSGKNITLWKCLKCMFALKCQSKFQPASKLTKPATLTIEDNNISQNLPDRDLSKLVYSGRSLILLEAIMHKDRSQIKKYCNKVEIIHVSEKIYDLDFNDARSVLCYKNNWNLVYYNGKMYREYSARYSPYYQNATNGLVIAQYRCNASVNCPAELRICRDTPNSAYILRYEHHYRCSDYNLALNLNDTSENTYVTCKLLNLFKSDVSDENLSTHLIYFRGYLYKQFSKYCTDKCGHCKNFWQSNHPVLCTQPKYVCHFLTGNCTAYLILTNASKTNIVLKVGRHTCKGELPKSDAVDSIDSDYEEAIEQCDLKDVLKDSIEIHHETGHFQFPSEAENHGSGSSENVKCPTSDYIGDLNHISISEEKNHEHNRRSLKNTQSIAIHTSDDENVNEELIISHNPFDVLNLAMEPQSISKVGYNKTPFLTTDPITDHFQFSSEAENYDGRISENVECQNSDYIGYLNHISISEEKRYEHNIRSLKNTQSIASDDENVKDELIISHSPFDALNLAMEPQSISKVGCNKTPFLTTDPITDHFQFSSGAENYDARISENVECQNSDYIGYLNHISISEEKRYEHNIRSLLNTQSIATHASDDENVKDELIISHSPFDPLNFAMELQSISKVGCNKTPFLTTDPITKTLTLLWENTVPVQVKKLGSIIGDRPEVDSSDQTTVYSFYDSTSNKKMFHYNGYNYCRAHRTTLHKCSAVDFCFARLRVEDGKVAVFGPHKCRSPDNLKSNSVDIIDSTCLVKELLSTSSQVIDLTLDEYTQSDDVDVDSDKSEERVNVKSEIVYEEGEGEQVIHKTDHRSGHYSSTAIKQEDIDITEHFVKTEIEGEVESNICAVSEEVESNFVYIDNKVGQYKENMNSTSNEEVICETSDSSDFDSSDFVTHKDNTYIKEASGLYAWCTNSKVCSAMIKLLPHNKAELISPHICNNFVPTGVSALEPHCIDEDNEKTVQVEIKMISSISRDVKSEDQKNYTLTSGQILLYKGNTFKKHQGGGDSTLFICVNRETLMCPGVVHLLRGKLVQCSDHLCEYIRGNTIGNRNTVVIYQNRLTSDLEAVYKGFKYKRKLRTTHVSIWQCTKPNCTAGIKTFTLLNTLSEHGGHSCVVKKFKDKDECTKKLVKHSSRKKTFKNRTPVYKNPSIIPVYSVNGGKNLIYQGCVYQGGGNCWTCIYQTSKGCRGLLRLLDGDVVHVSKHDCFKRSNDNGIASSEANSILQNKYLNYTDFLCNAAAASCESEERPKDLHLFWDHGGKREFALCEGYVYKKLNFINTKVFKWVCLGISDTRCAGVLTTNGYKALATSQHTCKENYSESYTKELFDYDGNTKGKKRKIDTVDRLNPSCTMVVDKKDDLTEKKNIDDKVPAKMINQYENPKAKRNRSHDAEDDIEAQIPTAILIQMDGNNIDQLREENVCQNIEETRNSENGEKIVQDDLYSECERNLAENINIVDDKSLVLNFENDDPNEIILLDTEGNPVLRDKLSIPTKMEDDLYYIDSNSDTDTVFSVNESEIDVLSTDAEDLGVTLSRGPNGEYFVNLKTTHD